MTDAIRASDLTKRYAATLAVDAISFTAPMGATIGLLGGNGAGKTTTIAMLMGLLIPTAGTITVLGHDMATDRFAALARMNFSSPYVSLPARLLLRTGRSVASGSFPVGWPCLTSAAADWLTRGGLRLLGVDAPSVDAKDATTLSVHHSLFDGGAFLIENLQLDGVATGPYHLTAYPLLVVGADAAPIRAVLEPIQP